MWCRAMAWLLLGSTGNTNAVPPQEAQIQYPWTRLAAAAAMAATLASCADDMAGATASDWKASESPGGNGSTSDASGSQAKDAASGGYDSAASDVGGAWGPGSDSGGTGGGPLAGNGDQGVGLKPGGAQDIAFFRAKLLQGLLPKAGDMTIEGWLNEHDTWLPKAQKDRLVSLHALAGVLALPSGGTQGQGEAVLQLGLNSAKSLEDVTSEVALTVVIDRSGSMSGDKMAYTLAGLHVLADKLPKGTRFAVLSFSDTVQTVFPAQLTAAGSPALHKAIDTIQVGGGTNFHGGLAAGLEVCKQTPTAYSFKRILMLSDGVPTVGTTDPGAIASLAKQAAAAGCSVSSVGVGMDFSPSLMNAVAQQGNGTAWFLQNAEHAKQVFVQDLETMLLPVAEKLWIQFELAAGWKVAEIYGFNWVDQAGVVKITGPKQEPVVGQPDPPPPEPGKDPVAMPTLFASKRNGLVMARLQAPAGFEADKLQDLLLATVNYGYTVAKAGAQEQFSVPVQVPGLTSIPDGGLAYFASPAVRRSWTLLRDGLDLMTACQLAEQGQPAAATQLLQQAVSRHDVQVGLMAQDLPIYGPPNK